MTNWSHLLWVISATGKVGPHEECCRLAGGATGRSASPTELPHLTPFSLNLLPQEQLPLYGSQPPRMVPMTHQQQMAKNGKGVLALSRDKERCSELQKGLCGG